MIKDMLKDVWGNKRLQNDFINTFCEIKMERCGRVFGVCDFVWSFGV
jgi:hypothetical protein